MNFSIHPLDTPGPGERPTLRLFPTCPGHESATLALVYHSPTAELWEQGYGNPGHSAEAIARSLEAEQVGFRYAQNALEVAQ